MDHFISLYFWLWLVLSSIFAIVFKRAIWVFLCCMILALPIPILAQSNYGPMDSAGIGQLLGAGLYGLIVYGVKRLFQLCREKSKK